MFGKADQVTHEMSTLHLLLVRETGGWSQLQQQQYNNDKNAGICRLRADQPHPEEDPAVSGAPPAKHGTSSSEQSDSEGMSVGDGDTDNREAPHVAQVHAAPPGPHDISKSRAAGPTQPQLKVFPRTIQGNRKRSFDSEWSKQHPWLEYSQSPNSAYCFACRHFSLPNTPASVFTSQLGFSHWKKTFCQSAGGNLASIHSDAEHKFIRNYIKQVTGSYRHSWIGGTDAVKEFTWLWTDGSNFDYTSWNAGEPNNLGGENCLEMNWGGENWNDGHCTNQFSFVCSKNLKLERRRLYLPGFFRVLQEHILQCGAA
ncbi:collectin-12-like isoform X2 [Perca fluviatilis]|uniref:collectin-12-like isoform X2 n=1 Tax=Perca fluviatilis TaxID=8168 RepID=UPI001963234B|nr:collectin-12-like isoform X2 [Perca fluviatilis]